MPSYWFAGLTLYSMSINNRLAGMCQAKSKLVTGLRVLHSDIKTHTPNSLRL